MRRRVSYREWLDWITMQEVDPFTPDRADMRMARICETIGSVFSKHPLPASRYLFKWGADLTKNTQKMCLALTEAAMRAAKAKGKAIPDGCSRKRANKSEGKHG